MSAPPRKRDVLRTLIRQSLIPALLALGYASWDYSTTAPAQKTAAFFIHSWAITFFLIMWFVGQWIRVRKHLSDRDQHASTKEALDKLLEAVTSFARPA